MDKLKLFKQDDEWTLAVSISDWLIKQFESGNTDSVEYQLLLASFGKEKFEDFYKEHLSKKEQDELIF